MHQTFRIIRIYNFLSILVTSRIVILNNCKVKYSILKNKITFEDNLRNSQFFKTLIMQSQATHHLKPPPPPPASVGPSPRWIACPHKKSWLRACSLGCTKPKIGFWFPARFSSELKIIYNGCKGYTVSEEVPYFAGLQFRLFPGKNRTNLKTLKILAKSKHAKLKYPYRKSRKFKSQKND